MLWLYYKKNCKSFSVDPQQTVTYILTWKVWFPCLIMLNVWSGITGSLGYLWALLQVICKPSYIYKDKENRGVGFRGTGLV